MICDCFSSHKNILFNTNTMKNNINQHKINQLGFTLVEVILSLVVFSVLAAMITAYMGDSMSRSISPDSNLRATLKLYSVMEKIRLEYDNNASVLLETIKSDIGTTGSNPQANSFGDYNVIYNDYVECNATTTTTFTAYSSCNATIEKCRLFVTISDPSQSGIKVSNLFIE